MRVRGGSGNLFCGELWRSKKIEANDPTSLLSEGTPKLFFD
jgi:hypothetical protein